MTNKEIADRLRNLPLSYGNPYLTAEVNELADVLDPPRTKARMLVWWRWDGTQSWYIGEGSPDGRGVFVGVHDGVHDVAYWKNIEYKPARILAPGEVAVTIPLVSEWPEESRWITIGYVFENRGMYITPTTTTITRSEAENMETE